LTNEERKIYVENKIKIAEVIDMNQTNSGILDVVKRKELLFL
jgi:hypothetical protein